MLRLLLTWSSEAMLASAESFRLWDRTARAWVTVEGGCVTLTDRDGKHINSRAMLKGEDPAALARVLLHEARAGTDFNRAISYQKSGVA